MAEWAVYGYSTVVALQALATTWALARVGLLISQSQPANIGGIEVMLTEGEKIGACSFGHYIFINEADAADEQYRVIVQHEMAHAASHHWIDKMAMRALAIVQWYNPAVWAMQRELSDIHEYQADGIVLAGGTDAMEYQMLIIKKAVGKRYSSLANNLTNSSLNKRITMMLTKTNSRKSAWRSVLAAIAACALVAVLSMPATARVMNQITASEHLTDSSVGLKASATDALLSPEENADETDSPVETPEVLPQFPGGEAELMGYLAMNMKYPSAAIEAGEEGKVVVKFVVDKSGKVRDVEVVRHASPLLDAEAIRVVKTIPAFTPGKNNGKPVNTYYRLPINFKIPKKK